MSEQENKIRPADVYVPFYKKPYTFAQVAVDLWGERHVTTGDPISAEPMQETEGGTLSTGEVDATNGAVAAKESAPTFEQLWAVTDERVEWTDALVYTSDPDRAFPQDRWDFFHRMAPRILKGELAAYVEVLQHVNPLGDLTPFLGNVSVMVKHAAAVLVRFQVKDSFMKDESSSKRYVAGIALRSARDLMAILPIEQVTVSAENQEKTLLEVTYQKSSLIKTSFGFLDPVAFTDESGGVWHE